MFYWNYERIVFVGVHIEGLTLHQQRLGERKWSRYVCGGGERTEPPAKDHDNRRLHPCRGSDFCLLRLAQMD